MSKKRGRRSRRRSSKQTAWMKHLMSVYRNMKKSSGKRGSLALTAAMKTAKKTYRK